MVEEMKASQEKYASQISEINEGIGLIRAISEQNRQIMEKINLLS